MKEEKVSQGTCSSQRGVDAFQLKLKSVGTIFRQPQSCKHSFLRPNRQYHLKTIMNTAHAPVDKTRKALRTLIFRCRIFFSLRRGCRHVSDCSSADQTVSSIQALLSALRRLTMETDLAQFAHAVHWNRGLVICQEACLERLMRCSLILLPGQRNVSRRSRDAIQLWREEAGQCTR